MKLTDICDFQGGSQPPKDEWSFEEKNGYVRMLQIRDFTQGDKVIPEYVKLSGTTKLCKKDDVLIARYGASLGKILTGLEGAYNVAIMRTIPDESVLRKSYLYYYLKSPYFQNSILNVGVRAAQAGFNKEDLAKLDILCPSLNEQDSMIDCLEHIEKILDYRNRQLCALDKLIKARFVELFGDPITNTKGLETKDLKDVMVLKAGDFTAASDISDEPTEDNKYPCYGGNGIRGYVAEYNQEGDFSLIGRQGALSGNVQYATGKFKNTEHALLVTPIIPMNSIWLNQLLLNLDLKRYQTGAAQPGLSVKNLQEIQIISVSMEEQNKFAEFVKQIDKSRLIALQACYKT